MRAGDTHQKAMDLHGEQVLLSWREEVAIAMGKRNWVRVAGTPTGGNLSEACETASGWEQKHLPVSATGSDATLIPR